MTKTTSLAAASALVASLFATSVGAQTVAFLMPDQASTRYEEHDWPGFQAAMGELCPDCTLIYQNGNADVALQQHGLSPAEMLPEFAHVVDAVCLWALVVLTRPSSQPQTVTPVKCQEELLVYPLILGVNQL